MLVAGLGMLPLAYGIAVLFSPAPPVVFSQADTGRFPSIKSKAWEALGIMGLLMAAKASFHP
jgi:hypothetical protein